MSTQKLYRWGGMFTVLIAAITILAGFALYLTREKGLGDPTMPQIIYTAMFVMGPFALMPLYFRQAERAGRLGLIGFILATLGLILGVVPAFLWIPTVSGAKWGPTALMYSWGVLPVLPIGSYAEIIGFIMFGIATARAGVFPRKAGWLLTIGALIAFPVELPMIGTMFSFLWPLVLIFENAGAISMGVSMLREQRANATNRVSATVTA